MRVALLVLSDCLSGAEKRLVRIFLRVSCPGVEFRLVTNTTLLRLIHECPEFKEEIDAAERNGRVTAVNDLGKFAPAAILRTALGLRRKLKADKVDYIHSALMTTFPLASCLAWLGGKILFEVTSPKVAQKFSRPHRRWAARRFDQFLFVTKTVRDAFQKATAGTVLAKIKSTTHSTAMFAPKAGEIPAVEFSAKKNAIVFASRFIPRKNALLFAGVARDFLKARPDWFVHMLGDGEEMPQVSGLLEDGVAAGQVWIGRVSDPSRIFAESKIMASLISTDNFPSQSVLEGLAAGCAMLLSDRGESHKFLNGTNGFTVEPEHGTVLEKLLFMTSGDFDLEGACAASRQHVQAAFGGPAYAEALKSVYGQRSR
ncbi:MAG: glycosyltransferase [Verrucomicrobiota bacterium]